MNVDDILTAEGTHSFTVSELDANGFGLSLNGSTNLSRQQIIDIYNRKPLPENKKIDISYDGTNILTLKTKGYK
jgi:hypothetical protein